MSLKLVPYNAPTFTALSTDISGGKISGLNYVGAKVFIIDTGVWYVVKDDLSLGALTGASGSMSLSAALPAGTNTIGATLDAGPAQTVTRTYTESADMRTAAAITAAPASGKKVALMDLIISTDTQMVFDIEEETSGTVLQKYYLPAYSTIQITPRGYIKVATADRRLMGKASVAGNISVRTVQFDEA